MIDSLISNLIERKRKWELPKAIENTIIYQKKIISSLCKIIVDNTDIKNHSDYKIKEKDKFNNKRIAIVWNSPNIVWKNFWKDIDSHDIVIRLNTWIISSKLNSEDTWEKTDLWWVSAIDAICHEEVSKELQNWKQKFNDILIWLPESPLKQWHYFYYFYILFFKLKNYELFFSELNSYKKHIQDLSEYGEKDYIPSTWYIFIMFLLSVSENSEIDIYGFSFSSEHRILTDSPWWSHNFEKEREIIENEIANRDNLKLHK